MERSASRLLVESAALARIAEIGGAMDTEATTAPSTVWALGDYDRFARATVWGVGPELVEASAIEPGMRVLDVAAGTGNVALRAAEAGARVVACDVTPESLAVGAEASRTHGLQVEWVFGDAQALPFDDGEFDAVTSAFGAMFAPDHQTVADELVRVCRPGGTIGMANFTPGGAAGAFFGVLAPYLPAPPEGAQPPLLWGDETHVRALFDDGVSSLEVTPKVVVERCAGGPREYCDFYRATFGPAVAAYAAAEDAADELDRAFLGFAAGLNRGAPDGPSEYPYEYVLVVARR